MNVNMVSEIIYKKISEIKPYVRNPRKNDKTVELLTEIIPKVGFNVPIVIDKKGVIVKGHARFMAAIRLKMKEVPCVITYADDETIKLDRIADNKVSEFSEWNVDGLISELSSMTLDFDYGSIGLPDMREMEMPEMTSSFENDIPLSNGDQSAPFIDTPIQPQTPNVNITINPTASEINPGTPARRFIKAVCPICGKTKFIMEDQLIFE